MMKRIYIYFSYILLIGLVACESEIEIDLPPPETLVVVDGTIENGQFPGSCNQNITLF